MKQRGVRVAFRRVCGIIGELFSFLSVHTYRIMNTSHDEMPDLEAHLEDDLSQFEMQIAHRADELWRRDGQGRGSDIEFWLRAEREVINRRLARARAELRKIT